MEEDSFPIRLLKSLGKQKLEKELKRLKMEEEASVKISLENRFKEALRKAKEVRENIRYYDGEPSVAECLAYDMQYVEKYVEHLEEENEKLKMLGEMQHTHLVAKTQVLKDCIPKSKIKEKIEEYKRLGNEFYDKFLETNKTNIDIHDAGLSCDAKVQVLREILEKE